LTRICRALLMAGLMIACLMISGFSGTAAADSPNGIPVLMYHHVRNDHGRIPKLTVSVREFERQMSALQAAGFHTISPDSLVAYVAGERVILPDKPIVITFDDGYEDNYSQAFPILKRHGFQAAIFVVGINFDRPNRLTSHQVREMLADGFTIGAHSMTHKHLTDISGEQLTYEVAGSKRVAERATHHQVKYFSYPGGHFNVETINALREAGYKGAFTGLTGLNRPRIDHVFMLRRIAVNSFTNFDKLLERLNANHPKKSLLDYNLQAPGHDIEY
jgi:peptidoglycan/xylan/chitin deacetylase (PgdA/CDA1 family)